MAFQTGTASSYADLQSTIETFLTGTPGYTLTSGILTKTGTLIHMQFTNSSIKLELEMGKDSSAGALLYTHHIGKLGRPQTVMMVDNFYDGVTTPVFPINYYIFYFSSPVEMFRCVIEYNNGYTQNIGFGEIVKAGGFFGGVYVDASAAKLIVDPDNQDLMSSLSWKTAVTSAGSLRNPLPFGNCNKSGVDENPASTQLWAEVSGFDWWTTREDNPSDALYDGTKYERAAGGWSVSGVDWNTALYVGRFSEPEANGSLQTHNANNVLVPIRLFGHLPNDNYMRLGDINDIRYTNIKHRNFAEIIDDGTDKWMCFPAFFKNASQLDGGPTHSGQIGYAVRYDGP